MKLRPIYIVSALVVATLAVFGWKILKGPKLMTERAMGVAVDVYGGKPGSIRRYLDKKELAAMGLDEDRAVQIYDSLMAPVFKKFTVELGDSKVAGRGAQAIQNIVWRAPDGESFETFVSTYASDNGEIYPYKGLVYNYWLCKYKLDGKGPFNGKSKIPAFWYGIETEADRFKAMGVKGFYSPDRNPPLSTWAYLADRLAMRKQRLAASR